MGNVERMKDFGMLGPTWNECLCRSPPLTAQESVQRGGRKLVRAGELGSSMGMVLSRPNGTVAHSNSETVAACIRSAKVQAREGSSTEKRNWT